MKSTCFTFIGLILLSSLPSSRAADSPVTPEPLAGTQLLTLRGDIASNLVAGVDRFLLQQLEQSEAQRERHWKRDYTSPAAYTASVATNRARLAHILGVRDKRVRFTAPELLATTAQSAVVAKAQDYDVLAIRWPTLDGVHGEGLLLAPHTGRGLAQVVAIPDATQTPEQLAGLAPGLPEEAQYARRLAENGCRVIIPTIIDRDQGPHKGRSKLTAREFLYRPSFELGRHLIGYEVQKVLALVDWLESEAGPAARIGVMGWGDGGMLALYAGALEPRIQAVCVSGYFGDRRGIWQQPIDRNVFGLLDQFGDAELASLVHPHRVIVEAAKAPEASYTGKAGGAPAEVVTPPLTEVRREVERAQRLCRSEGAEASVQLVASGDGTGPSGSTAAIEKFLAALSPGSTLTKPMQAVTTAGLLAPDTAARQARQFREIDEFTQRLLVESPFVRADFMKRLDTSSLEKYRASVESYRDFFAKEVIGRFDQSLLTPNVRSRKVYDEAKWTGYEVVMDVFPEVIAYGLLLLPKDLAPGEKRPVVVCQHGLEGRPQDTIGQAGIEYYSAFAARLAERGFITFAPQNLYILTDHFRTLQRKANPLGKTLFSIIVPQHQQITDWLKTLPFVDPARIGFYGLSYGGKSAMRIPPLVTNYCLSICSADFNEWVWKNSSTRSPYSYVWGGEYEIFEFDLGSTFNYAEMAALIAPRPFMVERGHFDGVAPDETVAYEFAKVRNLYSAKLSESPARRFGLRATYGFRHGRRQSRSRTPGYGSWRVNH
ncbi:MAG: hypothetical protein NT154_32845 [Verrucomicrobia bacterium]|nr:hypothetical protein [Verrucomicrobiota bacterium]